MRMKSSSVQRCTIDPAAVPRDGKPGLREARLAGNARTRQLVSVVSIIVSIAAILRAEPRLNPIRPDFQQRPVTRWASPVHRIARIAHAVVFGFLGKLAQWHRPRHSLCGIVIYILG